MQLLKRLNLLKSSLVALILAQIAQRLFFITDNHFIALLGHKLLLIHSIPFGLSMFGQFVGMACTTTVLVLWNRSGFKPYQGKIFLIIALIVLLVMLVFFIIFASFSSLILNHFHVTQQNPHYHIALIYFLISLLNICLLAFFGLIGGILIAQSKASSFCLLSVILLLTKWIINSFIVDWLALPPYTKLLIIGGSTGLILLMLIIIAGIYGLHAVNFKAFPSLSTVTSIWMSEFWLGVIRASTPFLITLQLAVIHKYLIVTYQLVIHLAYLICIPLSSCINLGVKQASALVSKNKGNWLNLVLKQFFYKGLLPTEILLVVTILFCSTVFSYLYNQTLSRPQHIFVLCFLLATMIGQISNLMTIVIRAYKKNHWITLNFLLSELIVMVGGIQMSIYFGWATTLLAGLFYIAFTTAYLFLNTIALVQLVGRKRLKAWCSKDVTLLKSGLS